MNIDVCSSACVCRYCRNWPEPAPAPLPQQQPWELSQGNDTHQDHAADDADVTSMGIFAGCCSSVLNSGGGSSQGDDTGDDDDSDDRRGVVGAVNRHQRTDIAGGDGCAVQ